MVETGQNVVKQVTPGGVPPITAAYAKLGVEMGYKPRDVSDLRMFLVGPSGEGKTTFLSSIPDTLILDFEGGAEGVPGSVAKRLHIRDYDHYISVIDLLLADAKAGKFVFKRVAFDTVDEWVGLIATQLAHEKDVEDIVEYGAKGHGWSLLKNRCWSKLRELQQAGYTWTCVGHITEKTIVDPITQRDKTVIRASVFPGLAGSCVRNSEFYATIFSLTTEEPVMRDVVLAGGVKRRLPVPGETKRNVTYYFDCSSVAGKEGKKRGVPAMETRFKLPLVGGWEVFSKKYTDAVTKSYEIK